MGNFNEKVGHLYHFVNFFIRNEVFTPNLNVVANILIFQMHRYDGAALEAERSHLLCLLMVRLHTEDCVLCEVDIDNTIARSGF